MLVVTEVDERGRIVRNVQFDDTDLPGALAALDERSFADSEGTTRIEEP